MRPRVRRHTLRNGRGRPYSDPGRTRTSGTTGRGWPEARNRTRDNAPCVTPFVDRTVELLLRRPRSCRHKPSRRPGGQIGNHGMTQGHQFDPRRSTHHRKPRLQNRPRSSLPFNSVAGGHRRGRPPHKRSRCQMTGGTGRIPVPPVLDPIDTQGASSESNTAKYRSSHVFGPASPYLGSVPSIGSS